MRGINKVILLGNLGHDPDVKSLPSGTKIANCSLATSRVWTDNSGQRNERVEWHRLVMFDRLAEITEQFLYKGAPVYIEGSLQTRKWEKEGVQVQTTEIVVREMQMLGGRRGDAPPVGKPSYADGGAHDRRSADKVDQPPESQAPFDDFDDDIPF